MRIILVLRRVLTACSVAISLAVLACASNVTAPSDSMPSEFAGAPGWVVRGCSALDDESQICGVGSMGGTKNMSLARTTAVARGRTEIARTLQVQVKSMLKDYQATTTGGEEYGTSASDEQHVADVSKQITNIALTGTEMKNLWVSRSNTVYALVVLDLEKFTDSVSKMENLSEEIRRAVEERARAAFGELNDEVDKQRLSLRAARPQP